MLTIRRPDDMHLHLRDGGMLLGLITASKNWARAIIMPNIQPPILTVVDAAAYRGHILAYDPPFRPLMTLYLTDSTDPEEIRRAKDSGFVHGVKLYPQGATTNSAAGVSSIEKVLPVLEVMQEVGLPLLIHGEVTREDGKEVDFFDREKRFIQTTMVMLHERFPDLRMVLEHVTTQVAVEWVVAMQPWMKLDQARPTPRICATITAHHLLENRNALFRDGLNPHNYCLPILKRESDRLALQYAAASGMPCFFAGTDSAPHFWSAKESACGCAGCFTAPHALELYAEAFDRVGAIEKLEDFTSRFGAEFYGLPLNEGVVTLTRRKQIIPGTIPVVPEVLWVQSRAVPGVVPFWAGRELGWVVA